jgi:hypothetical protein
MAARLFRPPRLPADDLRALPCGSAANLIRGDRALEQSLKLDQWGQSAGLPDNAAGPIRRPSPRSIGVTYVQRRGPARDLPYAQWNWAERVRFLNALPREFRRGRLAELDRAFGLSTSGNSKCCSPGCSLRSPTASIRGAGAERFLTGMGRRKFVSPLFETLVGQGEWGRPIAQRIYARARPDTMPSRRSRRPHHERGELRKPPFSARIRKSCPRSISGAGLTIHQTSRSRREHHIPSGLELDVSRSRFDGR